MTQFPETETETEALPFFPPMSSPLFCLMARYRKRSFWMSDPFHPRFPYRMRDQRGVGNYLCEFGSENGV